MLKDHNFTWAMASNFLWPSGQHKQADNTCKKKATVVASALTIYFLATASTAGDYPK